MAKSNRKRNTSSAKKGMERSTFSLDINTENILEEHKVFGFNNKSEMVRMCLAYCYRHNLSKIDVMV